MGADTSDDLDTTYVVMRRVIRALPFTSDEAAALDAALSDVQWDLL